MSRPKSQEWHEPLPNTRYVGRIAFDGLPPDPSCLATSISWMTVAETLEKEDPRCRVLGINPTKDGLVIWKEYR